MMKNILLSVTLLITTALTAIAQPLRIGEKVPNIVAKDIWGQNFDLYAHNEGRFILIDFWASWCGPCMKDAPKLVKNYKKFKDKKFKNAPQGFDMVSISLDAERSRLTNAINKKGFEWEKHLCDFKVYDSEWAQQYDIPGVPYYLLIAPDHTLLSISFTSDEAFKMLERFEHQ